MKKTICVLTLCMIITGFYSCKKIVGKGDVTLENRTMTGYNSVSVAMDATVHLQVAQQYSMMVSAQENLLPYIETVLEGTRLVVKLKNNYVLGKHEQITITIEAPNVSSFDVSGSGEIFVTRPLVAPNLVMTVSGSGGIKIDTISVTNVESMISGSGNIYVASGIAGRSDVTISGSGTTDIIGITSDKVYTTISGSGNIYCYAESYLKAVISGSGNIYYLGTPVVDTQISGSGSVIHL